MKNKKMQQIFLYIIIISSFCLLNACSVKIVQPYSPSILMSGKGNVSVDLFRYLPAEEGKVEKNQIDTGKGLNPFYTMDNIDKVVTDAVMKELKYIGYTLDSSSMIIISGDILEYSCDYIGISADFLTKIRFFIYDNSSGKRNKIYSKVHEGKVSFNKFGGGSGEATHLTLSKAIESFIKDAQKGKILH